MCYMTFNQYIIHVYMHILCILNMQPDPGPFQDSNQDSVLVTQSVRAKSLCNMTMRQI